MTFKREFRTEWMTSYLIFLIEIDFNSFCMIHQFLCSEFHYDILTSDRHMYGCFLSKSMSKYRSQTKPT